MTAACILMSVIATDDGPEQIAAPQRVADVIREVNSVLTNGGSAWNDKALAAAQFADLDPAVLVEMSRVK